MHADFADWFRVASIDPKDVDLTARWTAVETVARDSSPDDLLDTGRLFYGLATKDLGFLARLRGPFKATDDKFSMMDNNVELCVLAGAILVAQFELSVERADAAALTLTCGSFCGKRAAPVEDIVRLARESLSARSAALRKSRLVELPHAKALEDTLATTAQAVKQAFEAGGAPPTFAEPMGKALEEMRRTIVSFTLWAHAQEQQQFMRREESDVLWWLFAEHSRDLRVPLSQLNPSAVALLVAKEMADLTRTIPGPYAARAFLDKAIRGAPPQKPSIALAEAVAACPQQWLKTAVSQPGVEAVDDLCPSLLALRKAAEADGKKTWHQVFKSMTGLSATLALAPVDLAHQSYEEWLLARAMAALKAQP